MSVVHISCLPRAGVLDVDANSAAEQAAVRSVRSRPRATRLNCAIPEPTRLPSRDGKQVSNASRRHSLAGLRRETLAPDAPDVGSSPCFFLTGGCPPRMGPW